MTKLKKLNRARHRACCHAYRARALGDHAAADAAMRRFVALEKRIATIRANARAH